MNHIRINRKWAGIQRGCFGLVLMLSVTLPPAQAQCLARPFGRLWEESEIGRNQRLNSTELHDFISAYLHDSISTDLDTLRHTSLPPAWSLPEDSLFASSDGQENSKPSYRASGGDGGYGPAPGGTGDPGVKFGGGGGGE